MPGIVFAATSKAADAPDIEGGIYDARFEGVESKFITGGQYGDGDRFEWAFTLYEDGAVLYEDGEAIVLTGLTSQSVNVASKTTPRAVKYLKALMTAGEFAEFEAGNGVNAEELLGRMVQVEVTIKENGWPTVTNVLPAPRKKSKARPVEVEVDEE